MKDESLNPFLIRSLVETISISLKMMIIHRLNPFLIRSLVETKAAEAETAAEAES